MKPIAEFPRRSTGRPQCYCWSCWRVYHQNRYHNNKATVIARSNARLREIQLFLRAAKEVPCVDCGQHYPYYVMEFDHREGETKLFNIADVTSKKRTSMETLNKELAKCDVVCANCHRERTHQRWQRKRENQTEQTTLP